MIILLAIYMVMCAMGYWINMDLRQTQEMFFQLFGLLIIMGGLYFKPVNNKMDKYQIPILLMFVWFMAMYIIRKLTGYSIMMNAFIGIGVYLTVCRNVSKDQIIKLCRVVLSISCVAIFYYLFQYLGYDLRDQFVRNHPGTIPLCSFFGIEHAFGMYLGMSTPLMLLTGGWAGVLLLIPIIAAKSTGAMVGAGLAVAFFYWFVNRKAFWLLIVPVIAFVGAFVVFVDMPMGMQTSRFDMWGKVIQDSHESPLGYGLDSFRNGESMDSVKYYKYPYNDKTIRVKKGAEGWFMATKDTTPEFIEFVKDNNNQGRLDFWDHPHNEFIWLLYELGFVGVGLFIFLCINVWRRFWTSKKDNTTVALMACLLAIGVFSLTEFPLHMARLGNLIPIIFGLFYVSTEIKNGENTIS